MKSSKNFLVNSMEGKGFMFGHVDGLHYKSHEISLRRGESYKRFS